MGLGGFFKNLGKGALAVVKHTETAVQTVEAVSGAVTALKGPDKKAAAINIVTGTLPLVESLAGVDLNDNALVTAIDKFIEAKVALENAAKAIHEAIESAKQIKG